LRSPAKGISDHFGILFQDRDAFHSTISFWLIPQHPIPDKPYLGHPLPNDTLEAIFFLGL
jgi:hypothetical protein